MKKFGEYIKELRAKRRISLRKFCTELEYDPSNWSKIERGVLPPPKSRDFLNRIAEILTITPESDEYYYIFDSAVAAHIPMELVEDKESIEMLPMFFRASRGGNPTEQELESLIKLIKNS